MLLSSRGGFLVWMALNSRSIPFGQNMRMRFMHAIQSFLQISYWHQCIWPLFNPVVRFRVMHMTWPWFIFDPPLHVQPRQTNEGNNEVLEQLWKENPFQGFKAIKNGYDNTISTILTQDLWRCPQQLGYCENLTSKSCFWVFWGQVTSHSRQVQVKAQIITSPSHVSEHVMASHKSVKSHAKARLNLGLKS